MFNYAFVKDGIVVGVQSSSRPIDSPELIEIAQYDASLVGGRYEQGEFIKAQGDNRIRDITKGAFYGRLTLEEAVALEAATQTDNVLRVLDKRLNLRSHVNLDFPELQQGLAYMVQAGILTEQRAAELVVDGGQSEQYKGA